MMEVAEFQFYLEQDSTLSVKVWCGFVDAEHPFIPTGTCSGVLTSFQGFTALDRCSHLYFWIQGDQFVTVIHVMTCIVANS